MDTNWKTETDIISAASTGNREAFRVVVERYQSLVCSVTYSATGDISLSEDIAQEVFLAAWHRLRDLRDPNKIPSWLCGIARNILRDRIRKETKTAKGQTVSLDSVMEPVSMTNLPHEHAISKEEEKILWQNLEKIPEIYREPMILFYREQESVKRVAELLELSEDAIKQRLSRGRKMLKAEISAFVKQSLGRTGPTRAFSVAIIAALPAVKAEAVGTGLSISSAAGVSFWAALGSGILGTVFYLITGGYLILITFLGLSAYFLLRRPEWLGHTKTRLVVPLAVNSLLTVIFAYEGKTYITLLFGFLTFINMLALLPSFPNRLRLLLSSMGKTELHIGSQDCYLRLGIFLSLTVAFAILASYIAYRIKQRPAWGLLILACLLGLNYAFHSMRLIARLWSHRQKDKTR